MAEDFAEKQAWIDALRKLLYGRSAGVKRVSFQGRTVEYRDYAELRQALADAERDFLMATGQLPRARRTATRVILRMR